MDKFFSLIRKMHLRRGPKRWVGGVCGGIADKFDVDVIYVRIGFLILTVMPFFSGIVIYLLAWLLLPNRHNTIVLESLIKDT